MSFKYHQARMTTNRPIGHEIKCPHCGNDDKRMIEIAITIESAFSKRIIYYCEVCSKEFEQ